MTLLTGNWLYSSYWSSSTSILVLESSLHPWLGWRQWDGIKCSSLFSLSKIQWLRNDAVECGDSVWVHSLSHVALIRLLTHTWNLFHWKNLTMRNKPETKPVIHARLTWVIADMKCTYLHGYIISLVCRVCRARSSFLSRERHVYNNIPNTRGSGESNHVAIRQHHLMTSFERQLIFYFSPKILTLIMI